MLGKSCKTSKSRQFGTICCFKENGDRMNNVGSHKNSSQNFQNVNEMQLKYETGTKQSNFTWQKKISYQENWECWGKKKVCSCELSFFFFLFFMEATIGTGEEKRFLRSKRTWPPKATVAKLNNNSDRANTSTTAKTWPKKPMILFARVFMRPCDEWRRDWRKFVCQGGCLSQATTLRPIKTQRNT